MKKKDEKIENLKIESFSKKKLQEKTKKGIFSCCKKKKQIEVLEKENEDEENKIKIIENKIDNENTNLIEQKSDIENNLNSLKTMGENESNRKSNLIKIKEQKFDETAKGFKNEVEILKKLDHPNIIKVNNMLYAL